MTNGTTSSTTLPPFHSLPFPAYYRTECQDKYSTSRLAHHVAYLDNECASSLQLTPYFDDGSRVKPSYDCKTFIHGHQYSRKIRFFDPWVDAAGLISRTMGGNNSKSQRPGSPHDSNDKNQEHASKA